MLTVIEGLDGSGKSTQVKRLRKYLESVAGPLEYIHFPRYDAPVYGDLISRFLRGDFGDNETVHPQLGALIFAEDRHGAAPMMKKTLAEGGSVLLDRYVYSNIAYQCAKLKDEEGKDTEQRLTIADVNGGADYVEDAEAIAQFGTIVKTVIFDDVTQPENLKTKGKAELASRVKQLETIELTAADLATVDKTVTSFHLGTQVRVDSDPHGIDQLFTVSKLSIKLLDPAANKLTLGKTVQAFSEAVKSVSDVQSVILQTVEKNAQTDSEAVYNVERNLLSSIQATEENIKSTVAENYYLKEDTEALISSVSTEIEQTKNSVEIQFTQFNANIESIVANNDAEFEEIRKYIRFVDGKILLGEVGNELELQIANDRISFLQDGAEVAYFTHRKLYVTDAQFLHSLQLGNFAYMPRANGNLSFKKL